MGKEILGSYELNRIYQMDCLEGMKLIPNDSIDLVITDPPYLINYQSGMRTTKFEKIRGDKNGHELISNSIIELNRILKEGSHIYVFCSWHHIDFFKQEFEKHFELKNILIWKKKGGFIGDLETQYGVDYEFILFGYKKWDYYGAELQESAFHDLKQYSKEIQQYIGLKSKEINELLGHQRADHFFRHSSTQFKLCTEKTYNELINRFKINEYRGFREYSDLKKEYEELNKQYLELNAMHDKRKPLNGKRISGIIETSKVLNTEYKHPTQKPVEIINLLIEKSSIEGDVVLDCFMGSGTTAVASLINNRKFIGFETESKYIEVANARIESTYNELDDKNLLNKYGIETE